MLKCQLGIDHWIPLILNVCTHDDREYKHHVEKSTSNSIVYIRENKGRKLKTMDFSIKFGRIYCSDCIEIFVVRIILLRFFLNW